MTDEQLLAAVAAAHVPRIAAGKGQLQWPASNNMGFKALDVQLDGFVLGNPISSCISNRQIANLRPKLYQQVGGCCCFWMYKLTNRWGSVASCRRV